jgi:aspartyl-tRNA synthetase
MKYRTHTCGELSNKEVGKKVTLSGFVESIRKHGKIGFINLKDRYGITQVFLGKEFNEEVVKLTRESVVRVEGEVKKRPDANKKLKTGEIEVSANKFEILTLAPELPLEISEDIESTEETRLKYRYLDLRKPKMQENLIVRHKIIKAIRDFLDKEDFLDIETPLLAKSTPEGARDYLVPSRLHKGKFFALPQSPQLFKQLLMIAGIDKYFQIAKCMRDEDLRADRQPEFTQLDLEMSFVEEEDIYSLFEKMLKFVFKEALGENLKIPFERITYEESMKKYKSDKPDLRKKGEKFKFAWVTEFPLFEWSEEQKRHVSCHHPFTGIHPEDIDKLGKTHDIRSRSYDLVLNGWELGSGSIRIHDKELQSEVFKALKLSEKDAKERFGFFLDALKFAPPHAGFAIGLDRIVALITESESIREVIAFPKNKDAKDLMLDAPSNVDKKQLDDLGLKIR